MAPNGPGICLAPHHPRLPRASGAWCSSLRPRRLADGFGAPSFTGPSMAPSRWVHGLRAPSLLPCGLLLPLLLLLLVSCIQGQANPLTRAIQLGASSCQRGTPVQGITCGRGGGGGGGGGVPVALNLSGTYLPESTNADAQIPDTISQLSTLTLLDLSSAFLNGTIPSSMGNMTALVLLDLNWNTFVGSIPQSLSKLTRLQRLNLETYSRPTIEERPTVPDILSMLTSLTTLGLSGNNFQGSFPIWVTLLQKLQYLSLADSYFTQSVIPPSIGSLINLRKLGLNGCYFSAVTVPSEVGQLTSLTSLGLRLEGEGVGQGYNSDFSFLPETLTLLKQLALGSINISSSSSSSVLLAFSGLEDLSVSMVYSSDPNFPDNLAALTRLHSLELFSLNHASDSGHSFPVSFSALNSLGSLRMEYCNLYGAVPDFVWNGPTSLTYLSLKSNFLSGSLPSNVSRSLRTVRISDNYFTGKFPWCDTLGPNGSSDVIWQPDGLFLLVGQNCFSNASQCSTKDKWGEQMCSDFCGIGTGPDPSTWAACGGHGTCNADRGCNCAEGFLSALDQSSSTCVLPPPPPPPPPPSRSSRHLPWLELKVTIALGAGVLAALMF